MALPGAPRRFLHVFSTFKTGGPQVRFAQLANHFGAGIEHLICAMDGRYDAAAKLAPEVAWRRIERPDGARSTTAAIAAFRRRLRQLAPDLLLTYNWGAIEWAIANLAVGRPHIHGEDGFGPEEAQGQLRRRVLTRRLVLRWRARTVVPSQVLLRHARELWRLPPARLAYIPNGIDCVRYAAAAANRPPGDDAVVIGTVAAIRKEKNLARLLEAFATLPPAPPCRLEIVGDGPELPALRALAGELAIADRVRFAGHLERPETAFAGFDIFALSSDTEQMPISVLEAMAAGLPVAATDVGDIAAMVAKANRAQIVPVEVGALRAALHGLIADAALRQRLGAANQARARADFDQRLMFARYAGLFEEVLARPQAVPAAA